MASNLVSTVRDLQRRKARGRRGLALIEGVRLVEEALGAGLRLRGAIVAPDIARTARGTALVGELERHAVPVEGVAARTFARSEERRVGKEGRARCAPYHCKGKWSDT